MWFPFRKNCRYCIEACLIRLNSLQKADLDKIFRAFKGNELTQYGKKECSDELF